MAEQTGWMVERDSAEYVQHLEIQYGFLEVSCEAFDAGRRSEAFRLAATLRTLLHDTKYSTSLLTHLGCKTDLVYLNTAGYPSRNNDEGRPWTPLIYAHLDAPPVWEPRLLDGLWDRNRARDAATTDPNGSPFWLPVQDWLNRTVLEYPGGGGQLTAYEAIRILANKEGGAHVDAELPDIYQAVSRENSLGVRFYKLPWGASVVSYGDSAMGCDGESPVPATVRQLAFEMMWTLHVAFGVSAPKCQLGLDRSKLIDDGWPLHL